MAAPRPRYQARGWSKGQRAYRAWKDTLRSFIGPPTHELAGPLVVRIILLEWNGHTDADNVAKAVLDALQPWPLANDNLAHVAMLTVCRSSERQAGAGFHVEVEPWAGHARAADAAGAARKRKRRPAAARNGAPG